MNVIASFSAAMLVCLVGAQAKADDVSDGLNWVVFHKKDVADKVSIEALAQHRLSDGSVIVLRGTCPSDSLLGFGFEFDAKSGDAGSYYASRQLRYRLDGGETIDVIDTGSYRNYVDVVFTNEEPAKLPDPDGAFSRMLRAQGPKPMLPFVSAHVANFELPLGGRDKEIVVVNPQNPRFQAFLKECGFDAKSLQKKPVPAP